LPRGGDLARPRRASALPPGGRVTFSVGAHAVRNLGVVSMPLRQVVAHRVRSFRAGVPLGLWLRAFSLVKAGAILDASPRAGLLRRSHALPRMRGPAKETWFGSGQIVETPAT